MSSAPDNKETLDQALLASSLNQDSLARSLLATPFNSNGTIGRMLTLQVPQGPTVRRRPGICGERYERAKAEFDSKPWYVRLTAGTDRPVGVEPTDELMYAKEFKQECEKWPEEIPKSMIEDKRTQLNDHLTGKSPLPPEQSLKLRRDVGFLNEVYNPGPGYTSSISTQEQAWLNERQLRFENTLGIAFLGPIFGGPGAATRVLGGNEQQVATANQFGASAFEAAAAQVGLGARRATNPLPRPGENVRGAPLEPVSRPAAGKPQEVAPRAAQNVSATTPGTVVLRPTPEQLLKNGENAKIDPRKLREYALNPDHPVGGNKARVFDSALGFNKANAGDLQSQLQQGVLSNPAIPGKVDAFGSRFTVDIPVAGPVGSGVVRTGWIYKAGSDVPELTTLFVK